MGINLDKARAVRREAMKKVPSPVTFQGEQFALPAELPITAIRWMIKLGDASAAKKGKAIAEALEAVVGALFSVNDFGRFMALQPSLEDLTAIVEGLPAEYGMSGVGESQASDPSSKTTGTRSRRAAKPSTDSTPES